MGHRFTVAIVEDNYWVGQLLKSYSEQCGLRVTAVVSDGEQFISQYEQLRPDILLVDIGLEGSLDGIAMVRSLHSAGYRPKVIMVSGTTNIEHILTSFHDLDSLYFLSKPVLLPKFQAAIRKAIDEIQSERSQLSAMPTPVPTTWITVKNQKSHLPISEESILFVEKEDKRLTRVHLMNGAQVETSTNLSEIAAQSSPLIFSPFKGFLVNLRHVVSYVKESGFPASRRFLIHLNHTPVLVPLSRSLQKEFGQLLQNMAVKN
ncbi:LytR/AlgR family response regulator transcription factor [Paenibacillus sp. GCM10023248]|uniref:LytR/AlgR family response regulator transcription factor n=1 Tax=Bacillales TaxID=1385 RepID=UPI0023792D1D|nr:MULTISPECIES: LytTR family DNA-binding domain-containing protein [Bacillales]MDD9266421.1 LytTR family DNA-binding domain-containing protein [Paenibacillus sp. MAHUQ-63]MDR6878546.1 DNA-binding LytR/AlgR family response regulator [Bacillus sp. 3255]